MKSVAVFNTMEVLDVKPMNELAQECTIKVCYVSDNPNRNKTVINKEIGKMIAETLPGAPVVGFFDESTGDFEEHSKKVTFEGGEFKVQELTRPYGFVSLDKPWFQDFEEDGQIRTYLMCTAYLWTKQYAEAQVAVKDDGKNQSMELDQNSIQGYSQGDVFVFTAATLSKLCILGDKFEPCFEGANIIPNYCNIYQDFTLQIDKILERGYYVLDGKVQKNTEFAKNMGEAVSCIYDWLWETEGMEDYSFEGLMQDDDGSFFFVCRKKRGGCYTVKCGFDENGTFTIDPSSMTQVKITYEPVSSYYIANKQMEPNTQIVEPIVEPATEPAVDYVAKYGELSAEYAALQKTSAEQTETITTMTQKIESLEADLASYKKIADEAIDKAKIELIDSYKAKNMMTEEELKGFHETRGEFSLEILESNLALAYAKKVMSAPAPAAADPKPEQNIQLNIGEFSAHDDNDAGMPSFMSKAAEYDTQHYGLN